MRILVVTTHRNCPAVSALQTEGFLDRIVDIVMVENEYTYGKTLYDYWAKGEEFINVEHDMAPWPGAMREIWECPFGEWCVFGYPQADAGALGVIRFSKELMERFPNWNYGWDRVQWNQMDGAVWSALQNIPKHRHHPDVAHLSTLKHGLKGGKNGSVYSGDAIAKVRAGVA